MWDVIAEFPQDLAGFIFEMERGVLFEVSDKG